MAFVHSIPQRCLSVEHSITYPTQCSCPSSNSLPNPLLAGNEFEDGRFGSYGHYPVRTSASGKCRLRNGTNHGQSLSLILSPTMADTARQRDTIAYSTLHTDERSSIIDSSRLGSLDADANDDDVDDDDDAASASDHRHHPRPMNRCRRHWEKLQPGSISNLCSATLGAGALSLPYAISLTGIIFGVLLLMVSAYLTIISVDVIIDACVRTQMFKYEDVAQRLVGRRAGRLLEASLLIFCFGVRA